MNHRLTINTNMSLLKELTDTKTTHIPIMEVLEQLCILEEGRRRNPTVNLNAVGVKGAPKHFYQVNDKLAVGAAAIAISSHAHYQRNKKATFSLHAKDAYERRMITKMVTALTQAGKYKVVRTKFQSGGKTWVMRVV